MSDQNALAVSDEQFLDNPMLFDDEVPVEDTDVEETPDEEVIEAGSDSDEVYEDEAGEAESDEADTDPASTDDEEYEEDEEEVSETDGDESEEPLEEGDEGDEEDESDDEKDESDEEEDVLNYEDFYKQITAPFKANGKMVQVDSVEDAISLMQKGAGFNRRMGALKPQLKVLRMLENHDLLDESKLSFLIDLDKRDPQAINQLLKDSNIDPMEIDLNEDQTYSRSNYSVPDASIELDQIAQDLSDSTHWQPTLDVVTKQWDVKSKQEVADQPQLLQVIHDHMANGVYDLVSNEIERERMFGRLSDVSDIEAYKLVGDSMNERGAFNHLFSEQVEKAPAKPRLKSAKSQADNEKRREKRRAASPTKRTAKKATKKDDDLNLLSLSDEEFAKQFDPRYT